MHSVFEVFVSCVNVHFEAKPSKVVREEGGSSLDVSPGSKDECAVIYKKHEEGIKERSRCEGEGSVILGELYLHTNWYCISPRAVHSSSSVLEKAIIRNINSTGVVMLIYLTPTLNSMYVSIFPVMSLTTFF